MWGIEQILIKKKNLKKVINRKDLVLLKYNLRHVQYEFILWQQWVPVREEVGGIIPESKVTLDGVLGFLHLVIVGVEKEDHILV